MPPGLIASQATEGKIQRWGVSKWLAQFLADAV